MAAIGISTGMNSFFLGFLAAGGSPISFAEDLIAIGVMCVILSLYPVSQLYQTEEDLKREDHTFAIRYGAKGVKILFVSLFFTGVVLLSYSLYQVQPKLGFIFGGVGLLGLLVISFVVLRLEGKQEEYYKVMRVKFFASFSFVLFILLALLVQSIN